jgi:carbonic anhydrase
MLTFKDAELRTKLLKSTGKLPVVPAQFSAFSSLEQNVRDQVLKLKTHPWMLPNLAVRGFIYDVKSGRLSEVSASEERKAA